VSHVIAFKEGRTWGQEAQWCAQGQPIERCDVQRVTSLLRPHLACTLPPTAAAAAAAAAACGPPAAIAFMKPERANSRLLPSQLLLWLLATSAVKFSVNSCARCSRVLLYPAVSCHCCCGCSRLLGTPGQELGTWRGIAAQTEQGKN